MGTEHDNAVDNRLKSIESDIDGIMNILHGQSGNMGVITKMQIVWHSYVWLVGLVGVSVGSLVTHWLEKS